MRASTKSRSLSGKAGDSLIRKHSIGSISSLVDKISNQFENLGLATDIADLTQAQAVLVGKQAA